MWLSLGTPVSAANEAECHNVVDLIEWLLFNANIANFQLYHGETKLIFNEMMMRSALYEINTKLDFYSATSQKQQSAEKHIAPLGHFIVILNQPVFALSPEC